MYKNTPVVFEAPSLCDDHMAVQNTPWQPPTTTDTCTYTVIMVTTDRTHNYHEQVIDNQSTTSIIFHLCVYGIAAFCDSKTAIST